jgi:transcriptional pleiotropic regulator of transition state genes
MKVVKVTSKGQVTIPREARKALGVDEHTYLEVRVTGDEVRFRKLVPTRPLAEDDPIWEMVGSASSGSHDVSVDHDRYLAEGEAARWRGSS